MHQIYLGLVFVEKIQRRGHSNSRFLSLGIFFTLSSKCGHLLLYDDTAAQHFLPLWLKTKLKQSGKESPQISSKKHTAFHFREVGDILHHNNVLFQDNHWCTISVLSVLCCQDVHFSINSSQKSVCVYHSANNRRIVSSFTCTKAVQLPAWLKMNPCNDRCKSMPIRKWPLLVHIWDVTFPFILWFLCFYFFGFARKKFFCEYKQNSPFLWSQNSDVAYSQL